MANDYRVSAPAKGTAIGLAIAGAVAVAIPLAQQFEGYVGRVYRDPAGIPTVCYGDTAGIDRARLYSRDECADRLRIRMARDYAPRIIACLPELADSRRKAVFGALLDASYNAGPVAVCRSPMAVRIHAGQWRAACDVLPGWYVTARDRRTGQRIFLKGLVNRRNAERRVCLGGVS